jgi:hypothetical protein
MIVKGEKTVYARIFRVKDVALPQTRETYPTDQWFLPYVGGGGEFVRGLSFFPGQIEVHQVSAKTMRLPGAEGDFRCHPDAAGDFGGSAEAELEQ